jgi:hypothetical protein
MLIRRDKPPLRPQVWPAGTPKPKLPAIQLPIYQVHYRALEMFLDKVYRMRDYDFRRATGAQPGMTPEYRVQAALPQAGDADEQADRIRCGRRTTSVALILNVLCIDGFIPAGTYRFDMREKPSAIHTYRALLEKRRNPFDPECVRFREAHTDITFVKQAAILDDAVLEWIKQR